MNFHSLIPRISVHSWSFQYHFLVSNESMFWNDCSYLSFHFVRVDQNFQVFAERFFLTA